MYGQPNPIISFLIGAIVLVGTIALGILLLPVVGVLVLIGLGLLACLILASFYYRWRFNKMQKKAQEEGQMYTETTQSYDSRTDTVRTGVKRVTHVDDVTIVEEVQRTRAQRDSE